MRPKILVLNHHGASMAELFRTLEDSGATVSQLNPAEVKPSSALGFDGVVASGGHLEIETYRSNLAVYKRLLDELQQPFLGICLGLRILGHCYGARMRKTSPVIGTYPIRFSSDYPLAPGLRECKVFQSHKYELIPPLPDHMKNYASMNGSPIQAVKIEGWERYGVQFHPEISGEPAISILRNFVSLCSEEARRD